MQEGGAAALGLSNVGGVFVVLIGGLTLACVIAFFETLWNKRQIRKAAILVSTLLENLKFCPKIPFSEKVEIAKLNF